MPLTAANSVFKSRILQARVCLSVTKLKRLLSAAITISPGLQMAAMAVMRAGMEKSPSFAPGY